jgi:stage III sporulation protein AC
VNVEFIIKMAGIGVLVTVCAQVLSRSGRDEQASLVSVGGVIVALIMLVGGFSELIDLVREVFSL